MKITDFKLKYEKVESCKNNALPVIIVAAGSSARMNGIDKQFAELCGIPVLARTLSAFEKSPRISKIIVVTKEESAAAVQKLADFYMISKLTDIVPGGASRQFSVLNGMSALAENESKVLIHDGARPLVSETVIENVAAALEDNDSVCCATLLTDTVKRVNDMKAVETLERSSLRAVQTPQGVNAAEYRRIINESGDITVFTDDTSVMEYGGYETTVVDGDCKNIKITTAADIPLAEYFLKEGIIYD